MNNNQTTLGIDLGTSSVKVLVLDSTGQVLDKKQGEYRIIKKHQNYFEQKPEEWWNTTIKIINKLEVNTSKIAAIGLSGQLNGLVLVDENGRPLREAIIWLDHRSTKQVEWLHKYYGDLILKTAYSNPGTIYNLSKLVWLYDNERENLKNAHKILFPKDFIIHKLTGQFSTDVSDAGATQMLDLKQRKWNLNLLQNFISPAQLPELHESTEIVGRLKKDIATKLNLPADIPIIAGAGDMAALSIGTGVTAPNKACATIGTAGHIAAYLSQFPQEIDEKLWVMCHAIPGRYFWHGLVMTGGYSLSWFLNNFGMEEINKSLQTDTNPYDLLLNKAKETPIGSKGLVFLPYLDGVATPYKDHSARASFIGATSNHTKFDFTRAVLEGVAYNFRDSFEALDNLNSINIPEVMVGEGGSKNDLWPNIIADVLGKDVLVLSELNSSALGAAMLAGVGAKLWSDFKAATEKCITLKKRIKYNPNNHEKYNQMYKIYRDLYPRLKEVNHHLGDLNKLKGGKIQ